MKYLLSVFALVLLSQSLSAIILLNEDFSGGFLPESWSIDDHSQNWQLSDSNFAGGESPEARLNFYPTFGGTTRLITPQMDTGTSGSAFIDFRHMLDYWEDTMTIGVATRSGDGEWHSVWEITVTDTLAAERRTVEVINNDLGEQFQVCFYFTSQTSANLNYWYIDDVQIYTPLPLDATVYEIPLAAHYDVDSPMTPTAIIANAGSTDQTFNVLCTIDQWQTPVYSSTRSVTISANSTQSVSFDEFTPTTPGEFFYVHVTTQLAGDLDPANDSAVVRFEDYNTAKSCVLMEIFTGTWCSFCPGAALAADDMIANGLDAAIIEYHNNDTLATLAGEQRLNLYGVWGLPTAVFDGLAQYSGGDESQSIYNTYLPYYQQRIDIKTMFSIGLSGSHSGTEYSVRTNVTKTGRIDNDLPVALFLAVTESGIPQSWQGQDHLDFVERAFLPDTLGVALSFTTGSTQSFNQNVTIDSTWVVDNCELVAFVQNTETKEVYQAAKIALSNITATNDYSAGTVPRSRLNGNYPNPFNPSTSIRYSLCNSGRVSIKIYDIRGQLVKDLMDANQTAGDHVLVWNGTNNNDTKVASGVYFVRMSTAGTHSTQKILLMK